MDIYHAYIVYLEAISWKSLRQSYAKDMLLVVTRTGF